MKWLCDGLGPGEDRASERARVGASRRRGRRRVALLLLLSAAAAGGLAAEVTVSPLQVAGSGRPGFDLLSPAVTGIEFTNRLSQERYITNQIYLNGAGVAAGDVDGDGRTDLFLAGLDNDCALYRNLGGWRFTNVTVQAGVALPGVAASGCVLADLDGDGDRDLVVNSVAQGTFLLFNDGRGRFRPREGGASLNYLRAGMTAALADIDGDGDVDIYVANYRTTTIRDMPNTRFRLSNESGELKVVAVNDRPTTEADLVGRFTATWDGRIIENGEPDLLLVNEGNGRFRPEGLNSGRFQDAAGRPLTGPHYDWGLTAAFRDLNDDGAPDLYVCNDFTSPDRIWINDGRGHFRPLDKLALRSTSIFSMGVDFADVNRDGHLDFFVSDMLSRDHAKRMLERGEIAPFDPPLGVIDNRPQYSHNTLFVSRGDDTWVELAQFAHVEASEWTWSPNFIDVDLDGWEDLLITTGHELQMMNTDIIEQAEKLKAQRQLSGHELQRMRTMFPRYAIPNVAFRNRGDLTFEDVSEAWGFDMPDVGNAAALADFDGDGDLDVAVNNLNGRVELYRNRAAGPRVAVRLRGRAPNTAGIGARITLRGGAVPEQTQEVMAGGHYLSGHDPLRVFAAGKATAGMSLEIRWRSGRVSRVDEVRPNRLYLVMEPEDAPAPPERPTPPEPWFDDVSDRLQHRHHEDAFDDFARQPLLPRRLSRPGPGVGWLDVNSDGWEDLLIGTGAGGTLACYANQGGRGFALVTNRVLMRPVGRDLTSVLGLGSVVLAGSCNYQDGLTNGGSLRIYDLARGATGESVLGRRSAVGPLAMADVDGDRDLDLFIGGRALAGRYPEPADSVLLLKEGGRLRAGQTFEKLGLVNAALFSDLNGDGRPELVTACEWGPVRVFQWRDGRYHDQTKALGLDVWRGWWRGVASGDVDGDGDPDLVVANWGRNNRHRATRERPVSVYFGDLDESGSFDVVEAYINPATGQEVPWRRFKAMAAALPFLQGAVASRAEYGARSLGQLFDGFLDHAGKLSVNTLDSMLFLNQGDHFEARPLPAEAQWAPASGVIIADFDGDGAEDVFLSENFFGVNPDAWRQDGGRGLWLRGDGRGGFAAVPGQESGLNIYGDQRGCAAADFDGDGRWDLVVGQNAAATKLYRNRRARPGLRLRLTGSPYNPVGVGAAVRLRMGNRLGPVREIQMGSGWLSLNGAVQVLATPAPPTALEIRWPHGNTVSYPVPPGAQEVSVNPRTGLKRLR